MSGGEWLERLRWPLTAVVVAIVALGGVLLTRQEAPPLVVATVTPPPRDLRVYVSGAVLQPGVYQFREGDRVEDAVREAGGPSFEADLERLNLSLHLRDEMHVQVPSRPTAGTPASAGSGTATSSDILNLNTATYEQLDTLPGVGPVTAKRIIDQRERNGPYQRIEQLVELKIVNNSTFDKIKGRITAP